MLVTATAKGAPCRPPEMMIGVPEFPSMPGVVAPTQPKAPEANVRGSQEGSQFVLVRPERVPVGSGRDAKGSGGTP